MAAAQATINLWCARALVELDFFSQFVPMWIFIAYLVIGLRDRTSEIAFVAVIILATAAVLVLYAV